MRYDAEHKQKTREKLLKTAASAIRRDGPHNLSLSGVMAASGLTNGGFYAHFKSRDDLLAAGVGQMFTESRSRAILEKEGRSPRDNLLAFIDFYLSVEHRDTRTSGCALAFLNSEAPRLPKRAIEQYAAGIALLTRQLAKNLTAIGRADPEDEASSLLAELVGALGLSRAEPNKEKSAAILKRSRRVIGRRLGLENAS
jgi:TetR/AcrR family transcriptional repressor of nem operon